MLHFECSANSGENIEELFKGITKNLLNKIDDGLISSNTVVSAYASTIKQIKFSSLNEDEKNKKSSACIGASCFI